MFVSELHTASFIKILKLFNSLSFLNMEFFPSHGRLGDIVLCWKGNIDARVTVTNESMIIYFIFNDLPYNLAITVAYKPCNPACKQNFWNMIDIGFKGAPYTKNNKRVGKANIQECINRGFINSDWRLLFFVGVCITLYCFEQ